MDGSPILAYLSSIQIKKQYDSSSLLHKLQVIENNFSRSPLFNAHLNNHIQQKPRFLAQVCSKLKHFAKLAVPQSQNLINFGMFMCDNHTNFQLLLEQQPQLVEAISIVVLIALKNEVQKFGLNDLVLSTLVRGILSIEKVWLNTSMFQLLIGLVYGEALQMLLKNLDDLLVYFSKLNKCLTIIEQRQKAISSHQFGIIRQLLRIGSFILSWQNCNIISQNLYAQLNGGKVEQKKNDKTKSTEQTERSLFCENVRKFCQIDPQSNVQLIKTISQLFNKNLESKHVVDLSKIAVFIAKKNTFESFPADLMRQMENIGKGLRKENSEYFIEIVSIVFQQVLLCQQNLLEKHLELLLKNTKIQAQKIPPQFIKQILLRMSIAIEKQIHETESHFSKFLLEKFVESKCKQLIEGHSKHAEIFKIQHFQRYPNTYKTYTKKFVHILIGIEYETFKTKPPSEINLNQSVQIVKHIRQISIMILVQAIKNSILSSQVLELFCLLFSILETVNVAGLQRKQVYEYSIISLRQIQPQNLLSFVNYLFAIFKVCKNSLSFFLIVCSCLIISTLQDKQKQERSLFYLSESKKLIKQENFTKVFSFNPETLKALTLLSYTSKQMKYTCFQIICIWSGLFCRTDVEFILYQYDISFYTQLMGYLGIVLPQTLTNQQFIFHTFQMLTSILNFNTNFCSSDKLKYLHPSNNCINFIPIRHSNYRNSLSLHMKVLVNNKFCCNSVIEFYARSKDDESMTLIQKYRIGFKKNAVFLYNRVKKQYLGSTERMSDQTFQKQIEISILIFHAKFAVLVNGKQMISTDFEYIVENVRFDLNGDLLLKQFKWRRFQNQERFLDFESPFQVIQSEAEVKISKYMAYETEPVYEKIQIQQVCVLLGEILKVNRKQIDLRRYYEYCLNIMIELYLGKLSGNSKEQKKDQTTETELISVLFQLILQYSLDNTKINIDNFRLRALQFSKPCTFGLLQSALINEKFISQTDQKCQIEIVQFLDEILFFKDDVRVGFQNTEIRMFTTLCNVLIKIQGQVLRKYQEMVKKLIYTHQPNQILIQKISILFCLAEDNDSLVLYQTLEDIFTDILKAMSNKSGQSLNVSKIGKYILSENQSLDCIFMTFSSNLKRDFLDFMLDNEQFSSKSTQGFQNLTDQELIEMGEWFIARSKLFLHSFFWEKNQSEQNLSSLIFVLNQAIKLLRFLQRTENNYEQVLKVLIAFIQKSTNIFNEKRAPEALVTKLEDFYCLPDMVNFISKLISVRKQEQNILSNELESKILRSFFGVLLKMPKHTLFKSLQHFRQNEQSQIDCCCFILESETIRQLDIQIYAVSAFLQYLIEILCVARSNINKQKQVSSKIANFITSLLKSYSNVCKAVKNPILYCYPKMQRIVDLNKTEQIVKAVTDMKEVKDFELLGGVYFKVIKIIFHLIQNLPQTDFSDLLKYFFNKFYQKDALSLFRSATDFTVLNKDIKNVCSINKTITQCRKNHEQYYFMNDDEIGSYKPQFRNTLISRTSNTLISRTSSTSIKNQSDFDLTPFFVDYFFMKLFLHIESAAVKSLNETQTKILQEYACLTLKYLRENDSVYQDLIETNSTAVKSYQNVGDLLKIVSINQNSFVESDGFRSPKKNSKEFSNASRQNFAYVQDTQLFEPQPKSGEFLNYGTPIKSSQLTRMKSMNTQVTSGKKKRKQQLIQNLQASIQNWPQTKMNKYFKKQAKQVLFIELLHEAFVTFSQQNKRQLALPKSKKTRRFVLEKKISLNLESKFHKNGRNVDLIWKRKSKQIRKVFQFTCDYIPQLKLVCHSFPNGTFPLIKQFKPQKTLSQQSQRQQQLSPELLQSLLVTQSEQSLRERDHINTQSVLICLQKEQQKHEDNTDDNLCEISYRKGVYFCEWKMQDKKSIIFTTKAQKCAVKQLAKQIKYGSPVCNIIPTEGKRIELKTADIHQIFTRKYNQIKNNSLQFFLKNGTSIYIIFFTQKRTKKFIQKCRSENLYLFKTIPIIEDYQKAFQEEKFTEKWLNGQISNFDYLMLINKYSGRTCCDLNQYYIFPWILDDYQSKQIDISNPKIYRDLKKPIGALSQKKLEKYTEKLSMNTNSTDNFLYGSHYSTSLFIYYYLVRIQPYTSLHKDMQGGIFDAPDRLFSSVQQMWECLKSESSTSDIKQSIPQFYYFPAFLQNSNNLELGSKQNGSRVTDVELPKWATSPTNFIHKMRICFERFLFYYFSDYVSSNLNYWIDLIFGKDQKSFEKSNVFHPLSYSETASPQSLDIDALDAVISQISFFGQNPNVLFHKQHPRKKIKIANQVSLHKSVDLHAAKEKYQKQKMRNIEQENLDVLYFVSQMSFVSESKISLKISGLTKNSIARVIDLNMQNTILSLLRSIQKEELTLKRLNSHSNIQIPRQKVKVNSYINQSEMIISIGMRDKEEKMKRVKLNYSFTGVRHNEIVFVFFGGQGLRVYNWQQQLIWDFSNEFGLVTECYLEPGLIFFSTSTGKLFVYDFFNGCKQMIYEYEKQTFCLDMLVYKCPKNILNYQSHYHTNENTYKFVLVGDKRKIVLINYIHKVGKTAEIDRKDKGKKAVRAQRRLGE